MATHPVTYSGLNALLTPEESVLMLVDHQAFQFANMHSHEPQLVVGNATALAKTAKVFGGPYDPHDRTGGARRLSHQGNSRCIPRPKADQPYIDKRLARHKAR